VTSWLTTRQAADTDGHWPVPSTASVYPARIGGAFSGPE